MKAYFLKLYQYNDWANAQLLDLLEKSKVKDEYVIRLFSHILNAQFIWYSRIAHYPHRYQVWDVHSLEKMKTALQESTLLWHKYLEQASEDDFFRTISYVSSFGDAFQNTVQDCITQVANHSTYHRAQIVKAVKDLGIAPINTDYITYCRVLGE